MFDACVTTLPSLAPTTGEVAHPLDRAAWSALTGPHASFALGGDRARRYPADVSPFAAVAADDDPLAWAELRALYATDKLAGLAVPAGRPWSVPSGWALEGEVPGVQLVSTDALRSYPDEEAVVLGPADAAEASDLVARTEPGPFRPRTVELGTYLGIRREGRLVAMAGERLHPEGWTEISAVCTDPAYRRQGLATGLVRAVADVVRERGDVPFLHTSAANTRAIRLYLAMGFDLRTEVRFLSLRAV
ncbi:GNAT family N-acetyltransferase [Microlunatus flavus]|uniref:Predicted acetyltransferase, GNAT family n=1 Tax=Microlunatus flavus TaxID=1036181 RepID=A0A1H9MZC4_9ACTN|nr:GNAT family N-acetyltransferase [Microlunatus flavus]SER28877.1 Predicted acetyltransferase, GNAT family [Microlunatus flavus]